MGDNVCLKKQQVAERTYSTLLYNISIKKKMWVSDELFTQKLNYD